MEQAAYLRVVFGLIVVVVAILACAWMARRAGLLKNTQGNGLRLISGLSLGPRQRIVVVEVDGTWLVVGVTAGNITLLHSTPAASAATPDDPSESATIFGGKLGQALKRSS